MQKVLKINSKQKGNHLKITKLHYQRHKNSELFSEDKLFFHMALFCCE